MIKPRFKRTLSELQMCTFNPSQRLCAMGCAICVVTLVLIAASDVPELEPRKGKGKGDVSAPSSQAGASKP